MDPVIPQELQAAAEHLHAGRLPRAKALLGDFIRRNPASEQAWLLLSQAVNEPKQQKDCLERVLKLNPANLEARERLERLQAGEVSQPTAEFSVAPMAAPPSAPIAVEPPPGPTPVANSQPVAAPAQEGGGTPEPFWPWMTAGQKKDQTQQPPAPAEMDAVHSLRAEGLFRTAEESASGPEQDSAKDGQTVWPRKPLEKVQTEDEPVSLEGRLAGIPLPNGHPTGPRPPLPAIEKNPTRPLDKLPARRSNSRLRLWLTLVILALMAAILGVVYWQMQRQGLTLNVGLFFPSPTAVAAVAPVAISATLQPQNVLPPTWTPTATGQPTTSPTWNVTPSFTPTFAPTYSPLITVTSAITRTAIPPLTSAAPIVGALAPDFTLKIALNGQPVSLSQFAGQPVIVYFWNSSCTSCLDEMSLLEKAYLKYKIQNLVVLAVNTKDAAKTALDTLSGRQLDFIILLDEQEKVTRQYDVSELPTSFYIKANGRIISIRQGQTGDTLLNSLVAILVH